MTPTPLATLRTVEHAMQRHWVENDRPERLLLLSARPEWSSAETVTVGDVTARVCTATSTLAVRDVMTSHTNSRLVVLTEMTNADLGADLLSHAVRNQVLGVDLWDSVRLAFGLTSESILDGGLVRDGDVVARALVEQVPAGGWAPPPAGVLTRDHALRQLVRHLVDLDPSRLDAAGLLDWSREHRGVLAFHDLDKELRARLVHWLVQKGGVEARPVLDLAERGDGGDAVPLGLVAGLIWAGQGDLRAQGRLEARLGRALTAAEVRSWGELSAGWIERRLGSDAGEALAVLRRAEDLLEVMDATAAAERSALLPLGLTTRSRQLAAALGAWVTSPSPRAMTSVETTWSAVQRHRLSSTRAHDGARQEKDVDCLEMGVRLVRWLATEPRPPQHALEALTWQIRVGGWVDRARQTVANGVSDPIVAADLFKVTEATSTARAAIDQVAAGHVSAAVGADLDFGSLMPVEHALAGLRHVIAVRPTLLLVLDGMSAAVACELAESVIGVGWVEHAHVETGGRGGVLAAFPTVTQVSRASLLSGELVVGDQSQEQRGFRSVFGGSSRLFHQRDLESARGSDLSTDVRDAIQDSSVEVVGAVLNAVDDSLAGGDPARTRWTVDSVRHLRPLLERAAAAGRVVVLTSDHGHVVDQPKDGELRTAPGGGARWRPASGDGAPGIQGDEVRLTGRRVLLGRGDVVAAVSETLRYRPRKEGYHGGAALAEMSIPWMVMARRGTEVPAHEPIGDQAPIWWSAPLAFADIVPVDGDEGSTLF